MPGSGSRGSTWWPPTQARNEAGSLRDRAFWAVAALLLAGLAVNGQMAPWISPDTPSWLAPCFDSSCLGSMRFPLYGLIVRVIGEPALPWLQDAAFILAAAALAQAVRRRGASPETALALGLAPLLSSMMLLWGRAVLPDVWAQAALLGALAATLRRRLVLAAVLGTTATLLKPGLLPFIVALPCLLLILDGAWRPPARLLLGLAAPFLLIATLRLATVGDFNIVSFGGFQMSGMAALMLTPQTIGRLPADLRPEAQDILARRDALVAAGEVAPIPANSAGARSFASAAAGYFDLLARFYDPLLYDGVRPTRQPGESWVAFNARLQRLSFAVLRAEPLSYLAWLLGATARLVGRMVVFNPGIYLGAGLLLAGALRPRRPEPATDGHLLGWLVVITTAGAAALTVLTTFPAARYIDGAEMLIAAWPISRGLRLLKSPPMEPPCPI